MSGAPSRDAPTIPPRRLAAQCPRVPSRTAPSFSATRIERTLSGRMKLASRAKPMRGERPVARRRAASVAMPRPQDALIQRVAQLRLRPVHRMQHAGEADEAAIRRRSTANMP